MQGIDYWRTRPKIDHGDWGKGGNDWLNEYWRSRQHPHRQLIITALSLIDAESVAEIGCGPGPNLDRIRRELKIPPCSLAGVDVNADAIAFGRRKLPMVDLRVGTALDLPWRDKTFEVVLADAVAMYLTPVELPKALNEMDRVTTRAIVIVDRIQGNDWVWGRDYGRLLKKLNYSVCRQKITSKDWPESLGWQENGWIWLGVK